jgi:hypothetical protein
MTRVELGHHLKQQMEKENFIAMSDTASHTRKERDLSKRLQLEKLCMRLWTDKGAVNKAVRLITGIEN